MKLLLTGHEERYAIEQLQLSLFPGEQMEPVYGPFQGDGAESILSRGEVYLTATTVIWYRGRKSQCVRRMHLEAETVQLRRRLLQRSYYGAACPLLPEPPPWGALAGVRPTKITTKFLMEGGSLRAAGTMLKQIYYVTPTRRQLCLEASQATVQAAKLLGPRDISLYVGIPFCPTRCAYCSFVSSATSRSGGMVEPYLQALIREIQGVGRMLASSGLRASYTLYRRRHPHHPHGKPAEPAPGCPWPELGSFRTAWNTRWRPDGRIPSTQEKLQVLARHGVGRVSINPQSMDDRVLALCGRRHKAIQIPESYRMARQVGFSAINMDLIAGLPGDDTCRLPRLFGGCSRFGTGKHHGAHPGPKKGGGPVPAPGAPAWYGGGRGDGGVFPGLPAAAGLSSLTISTGRSTCPGALKMWAGASRERLACITST